MCGIVGYVGSREAAPILIKGLHQLEYRGYDSAGVALTAAGQDISVIKATGKVSRLESLVSERLKGQSEPLTTGIGHTRWATHGRPSTENAHPHAGMHGNIVLVHNGIIENYQLLKEQLVGLGYTFQSETDTEVLANLVDYCYENSGHDLMRAVSAALNRVIGAYAIVVMERDDATHLVAARKASPLVIGVGEGEYFVASDATPIVAYTKRVVYLDDEQIADIRPGHDLDIVTLQKESVDVNVSEVTLDISRLSKGGFEHFMLKEIFDQPQCIEDCMRGRIVELHNDRGQSYYEIKLSALENFKAQLIRARHVIIVACGTSWHAGLIGRQLIEAMCRIRVEVEYASEFRYRNPVVDQNDIVIAISQSGETADTLAAITLAKERGALVFGIVNGVGSSIARKAETGVYIHVGPEIGVASTKAFTGQVTVLAMLALALGHHLGTLTDADYHAMCLELLAIPEKMKRVLQLNDKIQALASRFTYAHNFLYLGRGYNFPVALEGALKLKEISYIHAEGYPAAEMKHGPIALIDAEMPSVFIATHHQLYHKIISNMQEVQSRGGRIFAIVTEGDEQVRQLADTVLEVPATLEPFAPLLTVLPLQMLAYHVAVCKGLNVDMPRNLAKSVTVE